MTLFGKILVLANFGLSVIALVCAMTFYFVDTHTDWTASQKTLDDGLTKRKARVAELWEGIRTADVGWRDVHTNLAEQEGYRAVDRDWYATEVKHARSVATAMDPARTVVIDKGLLVLDPVPNEPKHMRPRMVKATDDFGRPLASLDANNEAKGAKHVALADQQKKLAQLIDEDKRLTNELTPEEGKGLRRRIEDEKDKVKRADEELAIMRPLHINTAVENELILRRDKMLRARIAELEAALGLASGAKQP
jgi:hypothetical protein